MGRVLCNGCREVNHVEAEKGEGGWYAVGGGIKV